MKLKKHIILLSLVWASLSLAAAAALAQEPLTKNTLKLAEGKKSPAATIAEMEWFAGHWTGEAFGGVSEEIWSPPKDGAMMGMFRLVKGGKPMFYEFMAFVEENGSLMLRLKHFNANLTGWEEKNKTVDFPFVGKINGVIHFSGIAFRPEGKDGVTIYLATSNKEGQFNEEIFSYKRVKAK